MQLSLHLMACCGIRPAEVRRLNPDTDIDWRARVVIVRSTCSKTGGGRVVPLRGVSLLRGCPRRIPRNWQMRWQRLRRAAGFRQWVPDVLRHSFASYHAARFRNLPQLQAEMGHRDSVLLRTRYMSPLRLSRRELQRYWEQHSGA